MRVSVRWLSDYIDLPTEDREMLRSAFFSLGFEVESVEEIVADWSGVVVGRVERVRPHPQADRVRLCMVSTGRASTEVVCGAWNFEEGALVAFGPVGATIAGGQRLEARTIRGVRSEGMILSERELGLGEDHAGILVLDKDAPIGVALQEIVALPDLVYDLSITPNRPDAMSMVGIARELSAYFSVPYRLPPLEPPAQPGVTRVKVSIEDPSGCYRFVAREVRGARVAASPLWMRQRLRTAGIRPISNLVDVTNYVMLELGQPLHAFDLDQVRGERIVVRRAGPGERLRTLDGIDRILTTEDLVVADGEAAAALAGTMGGEGSEVGPGTSRVLIEAAAWDAPTVMHMSRRHGLRSEASARFERGVDPNLPPVAAARAARLMIELAGGETLAGWVDEVAVPKSPWQVMLPISEVTRLLGDHFGPGEVAGLLRRLHLEVQGEDPLTVTVPTYRPDLTRPVDLVEEIARLWGYDRFPETVPTGGAGGWSPQQRRRLTIRRALTGAGLHEALNLSFLGPQDLEAMAYPTGHEGRMVVRVTNPLNEELASLRTSLLPGLLRSLAFNAGRGIGSVALFEIGRVFLNRPWEGEDSRVPDQPERLGYALMGGFGPSGLDHNPPPVDLFTATALWRLLARRLGIGYYRLIPASPPGFHPGRAAEVVVNGRSLGFVGEVNPATASAYGLTGRVAAGELSLAPLVEAAEPWQFVEPSLFPPVEFDLAFEMPDRVAAATLLETTAAEARDLLESVFVFDEFRGGGLAAGRKSLALHYVLRAPDRTLTSQEAGEVRARMIAAVAPLGATLRGA